VTGLGDGVAKFRVLHGGLEIFGALQEKLARLDLAELRDGGAAARPADAGGE